MRWKGFSIGARVVIEPALSCLVRGISPPCYQCQNLHFANCENITKGDISEGVQTGYCRDTGGGWSPYVLAHHSQLHLVPDGVSGRNCRATRTLRLRDTRRFEGSIQHSRQHLCHRRWHDRTPYRCSTSDARLSKPNSYLRQVSTPTAIST